MFTFEVLLYSNACFHVWLRTYNWAVLYCHGGSLQRAAGISDPASVVQIGPNTW